MEELASIWFYQETIEELKQKLLCTTLELESVRAQANDEMNKNRENANQMLQHLRNACKERDEALDQIQKLLNKFTSLNPQTGITTSPIHIQPSKVSNSSTTESNSLSEMCNYQSPNDPFFDMVSSPDSSNLGYATHPQQHGPFVVDQGCLAIDALAKGKTLPPKGKLLHSLLEAGPLLKTLLVAGPLPSWRIPPPAHEIQIPPVSIRGREPEIMQPGLNLGQANSNKRSNEFKFSEVGCGIPQMLPLGPLMCFNNGSCVNVNDYGSLGKRQRLQ